MQGHLSQADKSQTVTASRRTRSMSKTAALVGCSSCAAVIIFQKWYKEGIVVNIAEGNRGLLMHVREITAVISKTTVSV